MPGCKTFFLTPYNDALLDFKSFLALLLENYICPCLSGQIFLPDNCLVNRWSRQISQFPSLMSSTNVIHDRQGHQISIFHIPLRFLYTFLIINSLPEGTNVGTPPFIGFFASRIAGKGWRGLKSVNYCTSLSDINRTEVNLLVQGSAVPSSKSFKCTCI